MECKPSQEKVKRTKTGAGHNKRAVNWEAIQLAEKERRAQKKRKISKRQRRKAFQEFITVAFHGQREVEV